MNQNKDYEFVSAAMDDDNLSEEMLDKLLSDDEAQQKWREYHIIRDCMQRAQSSMGKDIQFIKEESFEVAEKPSAAAKQQGTQSQTANSQQQRKAANCMFGGFAVAASVLAVAVGVWQFFPSGNQGDSEMVAEQVAPSGNDQSGIVSVGGKAKQVSTDAVANAEAQGAVVPNAARANQAEAVESKAVRVEKVQQESMASEAK
ncbi:sigma-E factor negative regulatory protein [Neisseria sp. Dent CA1/247]|uniref:sigma-E factor negative regulatory protein n=1 Tax=Neisseria sp. Dent CA1/247 TaxID=2912675 RepID=UPI001FD59D55|nr:sigma-E factor negative regulatory protein [Neisseria sp. Dent CA1/247]UOO76239.1 sigma-E factor negative regulatory protein [Neisseria sp. Dent CA1/247]